MYYERMINNVESDKKLNEFLVLEDASLNKFRWKLFDYNENFVRIISQKYNQPDIVSKVMSARGVGLDYAENYLQPKIKNLLPDPFILKDMDKAVERTIFAINNNEAIGIFGDYDVDGATSSSILYNFFKEIGVQNVSIHIPDRIEEGYGLNEFGIKELQDNGASLIISVDCGITGFDAVEAANKMGLDVIILDHHEAEVKVPDAVAVVDAKRVDDDSGLSYMAACGISFLFVVGLHKKLKHAGFYEKNAIKEPELLTYLDLVAFGSVCDVVPLVAANRAYVATGLKVMAKRGNLGLTALCDVAGIQSEPSVYHLGFILGPRINAGGRVGDSSYGAKLLTTKDKITATHLAEYLNNFNSTRQGIEAAVIEEAVNKVATTIKPDDNSVFVSGKNWHSGVIGIIAGRIKERYNLPTCVATIDENGIANGSGRSIAGIDLGSAIMRAKEMGILTGGGGHVMAVGFTLPEKNIPKFKEFLTEYINEKTGGEKIIPVLKIDSIIDIAGINMELVSKLKVLEPYGTANEEPRFAILNAKLAGSDVLRGGHIRFYLSSDNGKSISCIAYKCIDTDMGEAIVMGTGSRFNVAGKIRINDFNNKKTIQFIVDDVARVK